MAELGQPDDADWQRRFDKVQSAAGIAVWDWDMLANDVNWQGDCEAFGYSRQELGSDPMVWHKLMHPDDAAGMDDTVQQVFDAKYPDWTERREAWIATRRITYRIRQKDGAYIQVVDDAKCFFNENGQATRSIGNVSRS